MSDELTTRDIDAPEGEGVPWMPPPLFKYVRLDRALAILEGRDIRFTQPRFLNDPHELSVEINPQSLTRDLYEHMVGAGEPPERAADIACRNVDSLVIDRVAWVMAEREKLGVLSLCDTADNMLLWAHYADEHRGAVLELDVSDLIVSRRAPEEIQAMAQVSYSDKRIDFVGRRLPLWMTLNYKSAAWAYEREWRLYRSLSALRHKTGDIYVADLPPTAVKRIIFGARAVAPYEEDTIRFIQGSPDHQHIRIEKAMFSHGLVGLDFKSGEEFAWAILHGEHHFGDNWRQLRQWVDLSKMEAAEKGVGLPSLP